MSKRYYKDLHITLKNDHGIREAPKYQALESAGSSLARHRNEGHNIVFKQI